MRASEAEAINQIAAFIEDFMSKSGHEASAKRKGEKSAFCFENQLLSFIRQEVSKQELRRKYLPAELFGEPGWNILLDLFECTLRGRPVSVSDASVASQAPPTTGLRWVQRLEELGLLERHRSPSDARVNYLTLTEHAQRQLRAYFNALAAET